MNMMSSADVPHFTIRDSIDPSGEDVHIKGPATVCLQEKRRGRNALEESQYLFFGEPNRGRGFETWVMSKMVFSVYFLESSRKEDSCAFVRDQSLRGHSPLYGFLHR